MRERLVFSTLPPRCERCGLLEEECQCEPEPEPVTPPEKQTANVFVEKRKRGKMMTVVKGLLTKESDLPALLTLLKSNCGAGGTLKSEQLEIQGDHVERVKQQLKEIGYRLKK